jgi:hypothetical protein
VKPVEEVIVNPVQEYDPESQCISCFDNVGFRFDICYGCKNKICTNKRDQSSDGLEDLESDFVPKGCGCSDGIFRFFCSVKKKQ